MRSRLKAFFDVRAGELQPLLASVAYVGLVVASFLLAKPIRNGLFLDEFGAYRLVYVYVGVPLALAGFVPVYTAISVRYGLLPVIRGTLVFFFLNVLAFWCLFRFTSLPGLPAVFYIWVNCYAVIAPVQAWTFATSLFDTRQAKRLFGLIGGGASVGAILGGLMARVLVGPVGGAVNLMLVLALLIGAAAGIVFAVGPRLARRQVEGTERRLRAPFRLTLRRIARSQYLRLISALVVLVAVVTQSVQFQLSLAAEQRFGGDADRLTAFFGEFNFYMGLAALAVQLALTGRALRRFGIAVTILLLPVALGLGSTLVVLAPVLWAILMTSGADQTLRFSVDKATFELLYLPIPVNMRAQVKTTIDMIVSRLADALGGLLLGVATQGFNLMVLRLPGAGLGFRGLAGLNLVLVGVWIATALALRRGYVNTIRESIRSHRVTAERAAAAVLDRTAADMLIERLQSGETEEILYALGVLETQSHVAGHPAIRALLGHPVPEVRRRALAVLRAAEDGAALPQVERLVRDTDPETRTEALLYLAQHVRIDPLERLKELGDFPDFSIRAGMLSFLARPGRTQNLEAASVLLDAMLNEPGAEAERTRLEAARVLGSLPDEFPDQLRRLLHDTSPAVVRQALRAAGRLGSRAFLEDIVIRLGDPDLTADAADALVLAGDRGVGSLRDHLVDAGAPIEIRRQIPGVLVRIATPAAQMVLMESVLQADAALRLRIISALNKLRAANPGLPLDRQAVQMLLAAEILGHYRSYQILGTLRESTPSHGSRFSSLQQSMDLELERIFRLMALLFPNEDLQSAYFGLQSSSPGLRADAVEFLDNVLEPQLRQLLLPLLDHQVTLSDRVRLANRLVGAPLQTKEEAVAALASSGDPWLQACAAHAIGVFRMTAFEPDLDRWAEAPDTLLRATAREAKELLSEERDAAREAGDGEQVAAAEEWRPTDAMGVG